MRIYHMALMILIAMISPLHALINPDFTPVDIVRQAEVILIVRLAKADEEGMTQVTVKEILKGKYTAKSLSIDLQAGAFEAQGNEVARIIGKDGKTALLFVGSFSEGVGQGNSVGFLHLGGQWVALSSDDRTTWDMEEVAKKMQGTWAGSTSMLTKATKYILADEDAIVRVTEGVRWMKPKKVGRVSLNASGAETVNLDGKGRLTLFVPGQDGDRLFTWKKDALKEVTASRSLASSSVAWAWTDVNGDARLDLVSWNGKTLQSHTMQSDGKFKKSELPVVFSLLAGCFRLGAVNCGAKRPEIVAVTATQVVLIQPKDETEWKATVSYSFPASQAGGTAAALIADFDGDVIPDLVCIGRDKGFFFKGTSTGTFAEPVAIPVAAGGAQVHASVGDFDGDGLLDIVTTSATSHPVWQNTGKGTFRRMSPVGEYTYVTKHGTCANFVGDLNNDGLQDIGVLYSNRAPHLFFNRGFFCFGHARMMDLDLNGILPDANAGQQAACLADLNGDGAQDMALILQNGDLWFFPRSIDEEGVLSLTVAFPADSHQFGPVNVHAVRDKRGLGTFPVSVGHPVNLAGLDEAGALQLQWRLPGAKPQTREVVLEDAPVRITLTRE